MQREQAIALVALIAATVVVLVALLCRRFSVFGGAARVDGDATALTVAQSLALRNVRASDLLTDQRRPLTRYSCYDHAIPCVEDRNCELLCSDYALVPSTCRANLCVAGDGGGGGGDPGQPDPPPGIDCDTKNGEYAFLRGVTEAGVAEWACINLFPDWQPSADGERRFCEGGVWSMNADDHNPHWSDCACPKETVNVIYRLPNGEEGDGKPHCVPEKRLHEYRNAYEPASGDKPPSRRRVVD